MLFIHQPRKWIVDGIQESMFDDICWQYGLEFIIMIDTMVELPLVSIIKHNNAPLIQNNTMHFYDQWYSFYTITAAIVQMH